MVDWATYTNDSPSAVFSQRFTYADLAICSLGCVVIAVAMMLVAAGQQPVAQIDVRVNVAPTPLRASDGQTCLAYELVATNLDSRLTARLDRLDVFGESEPKP